MTLIMEVEARRINMQITILNKGTYEVDEGAVLTYTKNETLDSATIVISNVDHANKLNLEPYDIVLINNRYMCIDTYNEIMLCVSPKLYRYEITLFSETKQLEGIVLPNLKITKMSNVSRSVWYYLSQYLFEYGTQIKITGNTLASKFSFADGVESRFIGIECPEMQWNTPTLREVLNDLMMVDDCIVTVENCRISFMDLTTTGNDITDDVHINYVSRSKSAEDYVSELQCNLVNVTNSGNNKNIVTKTEWCNFSIPDNEATMTTENIVLKTKYPIYRLKSVILMAPIKISPNHYVWASVDLCNVEEDGNVLNFILEEKEWITKAVDYNNAPPSNVNYGTTGHKFSDDLKYQNWTLHYSRNSNEITGWNNSTKFFWGTIYTIDVMYHILGIEAAKNESIVLGTMKKPQWYNALFKVEYETLEGCLFRASKNGNVEHQRVVIDNQTNSYVDSSTQGFMEYQKANRLGNEQVQINARYDDGETMLAISDMYEDCVVYQAQYQYFADHVEVNALATKNYILRDYFTGVKSKIRSWKIVDGSEALDRHDLIKKYLEFSWTGIGSVNTTYFLSSLFNYTASPITCCYVRTKSGLYDYFPPNFGLNTSYYLLDCVNRVVGNSLVFSFRFNDNFWAGQSIHTDVDEELSTTYVKETDFKVLEDGEGIDIAIGLESSALKGGGVPMYQHKYANENGEFDRISVIFADGIKLIPNEIGNDPVVGTVWITDELYTKVVDESKYLLYFAYQRPRAYDFNISGNGYDYNRIEIENLRLHKDSQEITHLSTQYEFCTDTTDICFSKYFVEKQKAVNTQNNNVTFTVSMCDSQYYDFRRPEKLPTVTISNINAVVSISIKSFEIRLDVLLPSSVNAITWLTERRNNAFYLKNNNEVVIAFRNIPTANISAISVGGGFWKPVIIMNLNLMDIRDKNIYDINNHYLKL